MPPKQQTTSKSPLQTALNAPSSQTGISIFLRKLEKPISDIQGFLKEYPNYEQQFLDHEKAQARQKELTGELEEKEKRMKQLEEAVAIFEGVHMNNSKSLREENTRLGERLTEAKERILESEKSSKASQKAFVEEFGKLIKDKKQELEKATRDHTASLEKQKIRFEKQHLEANGKNLLQLNKVISDMKKQGAEMEKLELINDGLKDRASKLKELQQEFSNIPDDVL